MPAPNGCCRSPEGMRLPDSPAAVDSNAVDAAAATAATESSARVFSRRATLITGAVASGALLVSCAEGDSDVAPPEGSVEMGAASAVGVGKAAKLTHGSTTVIVSQPSSGVQGIQHRLHPPGLPGTGAGFQPHRVPLPRLRVRRS